MSFVIRAKLSGFSLELSFDLLVCIDSTSRIVMPHQGSLSLSPATMSFVIRAGFSDLLLGVFTPQLSLSRSCPTGLSKVTDRKQETCHRLCLQTLHKSEVVWGRMLNRAAKARLLIRSIVYNGACQHTAFFFQFCCKQ